MSSSLAAGVSSSTGVSFLSKLENRQWENRFFAMPCIPKNYFPSTFDLKMHETSEGVMDTEEYACRGTWVRRDVFQG